MRWIETTEAVGLLMDAETLSVPEAEYLAATKRIQKAPSRFNLEANTVAALPNVHIDAENTNVTLLDHVDEGNDDRHPIG